MVPQLNSQHHKAIASFMFRIIGKCFQNSIYAISIGSMWLNRSGVGVQNLEPSTYKFFTKMV